jgi:hypothetical protein
MSIPILVLDTSVYGYPPLDEIEALARRGYTSGP